MIYKSLCCGVHYDNYHESLLFVSVYDLAIYMGSVSQHLDILFGQVSKY
jgi:hypothetical protein